MNPHGFLGLSREIPDEHFGDPLLVRVRGTGRVAAGNMPATAARIDYLRLDTEAGEVIEHTDVLVLRRAMAQTLIEQLEVGAPIAVLVAGRRRSSGPKLSGEVPVLERPTAENCGIDPGEARDVLLLAAERFGWDLEAAVPTTFGTQEVAEEVGTERRRVDALTRRLSAMEELVAQLAGARPVGVGAR